MLARQDTDNLLSYYESPLADKGPVPLSASSSQYSSSDSSCSQYSKESPVASPHRTEQTADRQQMAAAIMTADMAQHNRSQSDAHDIPPSSMPAPKRRSSTDSSIVTFSPDNPASYLNYQPGIHATAGPLPPPPRLDPPPPRSARRRGDIEAVKQALQLPPSVSAALSKRAPRPTSPTVHATKSIHRREGASDTESSRSHRTPPPPQPDVVIQPPPRNDSLPEDREWVSVTPPPSKKRVSAELSISSGEELPPTPSPPPKSLRNSLTRGLRRMSLPRTPSRTPSPPQLSPLSRPKIKALYPSAMYCSELSAKLTTLERCALYTAKINELALYDCGLSDWLFEARIRNSPGPSPAFTPKPRNTSHGSEASEATFPVRPDAGVATDLSSPTTPNSSVILPYPTLAPRTTSSVKSGFFASLGRKASVSRTTTGPQPPRQQAHHPIPNRTVLTKRPTISPTVPGGPRAKRMSRSHTMMLSPSTTSSHTMEDVSESDTKPTTQDDPEFERQLDKLAVLLPHAERDVLAGYLRRSGQDMIAIGLYLDDEKMGRIRRP
ncbi:uncharacterized protein EV420DRAFT_135179 [Desarmillaria tabescens]|uniref:Uncharacterized protein n=1 Tax=Armillaria tabescens TaxID=1929756 RepID=A0AA39T3I8_ARMTA|nr:uncharacterized protein EV420DRAFT_135179 [Desarmillaria tabescens]KAK0461891.1 hypothetical protein EV420DRAFT_135179 [Desarmillaria tabescens]